MFFLDRGQDRASGCSREDDRSSKKEAEIVVESCTYIPWRIVWFPKSACSGPCLTTFSFTELFKQREYTKDEIWISWTRKLQMHLLFKYFQNGGGIPNSIVSPLQYILNPHEHVNGKMANRPMWNGKENKVGSPCNSYSPTWQGEDRTMLVLSSPFRESAHEGGLMLRDSPWSNIERRRVGWEATHLAKVDRNRVGLFPGVPVHDGLGTRSPCRNGGAARRETSVATAETRAVEIAVRKYFGRYSKASTEEIN